ncbi:MULTISPECIES: GNAT family N-acetyltransferase [unclassified Streptomyces]|uniref:GNAT family N-acetyltransferase n=1 Tax=unclassified Streptomyces TaxID=2593676 RepID=UPI0016560D3D|nr:GNAT family N-acetyltransferase [Streptomyces sp. CB02980]MCB8904242.1 GNAT family N-acetyltransferase [Streptomyces sp. CB02980]
MTSPSTDTELPRIHGFLSDFHRRQADRVVAFPGGFAALDDRFTHSRGNNHVLVDGPTDAEALPARAEELLGHLPYRLVYVVDDEVAAACRGPLERAGYTGATTYLMRHTGPVPAHGGARRVGIEELRAPASTAWRRFAPGISDEQVQHLVERRVARLGAADDVRFLATHTEDGEVASWVDLYLDPAAGIARIEDLVTAEAHLGRGHAGRVLDTALHLAAEAGCDLRFLSANKAKWPHRWYGRKGFTIVDTIHYFEKV